MYNPYSDNPDLVDVIVAVIVMMLLATVAVIVLNSTMEGSEKAKPTCTTIDYGSKVETICD